MKTQTISGVILLSLASSAFAFCQKRLLKEAAELEGQGRYEAAVGKYVKAMHHNSTKLETREALMNSSKKLMDQWLSEYFILRNIDSSKEMFDLVAKIEKHQQQLKYFGIKATVAAHYKSDFEADKNKVLSRWYTAATTAIEKGNYDKARDYFDKIMAIDTDYKDVAARRPQVVTAPIFEEAKEAYEQIQITKAWRLFSQLNNDDPNFIEASEFKKKIIEKHSLTVSVLPSESNFHSTEYKLRDGIVAALSKLNSPFIQLVDRENLNSIIEEQKLGLSGLLDESTAAEVGILVGAKAVLFTKILTYDFKKGPIQGFDKVAYQGFKNNGLTQYQSTTFREYLQSTKLITSLQVQLISSETGKLLYADVIHNEQLDTITYADYDGNYLTLYPAKGELIYKSGKERAAFLALFSAQREVLSIAELDLLAQKEIASQVAEGIENYFNN